MTAAKPLMSFIIPTFNREGLVVRAIRSCLVQTGMDFEVVVVDDGSTDVSVRAVEAFTDPRVRLIKHESNRGLLAARGTGVDAAVGEWAFFLDSDDELVPGCLAELAPLVSAVPAEVGCLRFKMRLDNGRISPQIHFDGTTWGFPEYLKWLASAETDLVEAPLVIRRSLFPALVLATPGGIELRFLLDLNSRVRSLNIPVLAVLLHQDAGNQMTVVVRSPTVDVSRERLRAEGIRNLLAEYESHLKAHAPATAASLQSTLAVAEFNCGRRVAGIKACLASLSHEFRLATLIVLASGALSSRFMQRLRAVRAARRHHRIMSGRQGETIRNWPT